jgi:hypothetical protein
MDVSHPTTYAMASIDTFTKGRWLEHGMTSNNKQFKIALKESLMTHAFYSVDEFILLRNDSQTVNKCLIGYYVHTSVFIYMCTFLYIMKITYMYICL